MQNVFLTMLVFVPIGVIAEYVGMSPVLVFFLAALGIIPLAKYIGESTEHLASHTSPAFGGFLNATFGNATELIISLFALRLGLVGVVQASLTGSIIANLLLVGGMAMFFGGWSREKQTFNRTGILATSITLLLSVVAFVIPAIFFQTSPNATPLVLEQLSIIVSIAMILSYIASIFFSLHTHKHLYYEDSESHPSWSVRKSILILFVSTGAVAWMSEILVGSIEPLVISLGWTELFIGVVVVAIVGNAAEHASAITVAMKNRMDLALQICMGSAAQIAMFVAPALVLMGYFLNQPMNLIFNTFEVVAVVLSILIANLATQDGESNWLEGIQLIVAYFIIAVAFFLHP